MGKFAFARLRSQSQKSCASHSQPAEREIYGNMIDGSGNGGRRTTSLDRICSASSSSRRVGSIYLA